MTTFYATMSYELEATTDPVARKLFRAELVGRRWQDRLEGALMPAGTVWALRDAPESETTTDVHAACELHSRQRNPLRGAFSFRWNRSRERPARVSAPRHRCSWDCPAETPGGRP